MTFSDFITSYDQPGAMILLEGKRMVRQEDKARLFALGKQLAFFSKFMMFRSGNAPGADAFFSEGVAEIDPTRLQVITPYEGHRKKENKAHQTISLNQHMLVAEPEVIYQTKAEKKYAAMVDAYIAGEKHPGAAKAAYLLRDTVKVLGTHGIPPATAALFYDDVAAPRQGGTGHTMAICAKNYIPYYDQSTWFAWL